MIGLVTQNSQRAGKNRNSEPLLSIESLSKAFRSGKEDVHAVKDVSLTVNEGELFTLLGPSGCGKTTTLRSIAGLEVPTGGTIGLGSQSLFDAAKGVNVPASDRRLGMVFQSYAVWPHMTVFENVAFPLRVIPRRSRPSRKEVGERVERVLDVVQLETEGGRSATDLSGGQQQRLALARALVMEPPLLLLDEPLSNLDAKLRDGMRLELKRLQRELGITSVYVTHDQVEALSMSNRIAVMNDGLVEQVGTPRDIYEKPKTHFVADFVGSANLLPGTILGPDAVGTCMVRTQAGDLVAGCEHEVAAGEDVLVMVRPEHVQLEERTASDGRPGWLGTVMARGFLGDAVEHKVRVNDVLLQARCHPRVSLSPGTDVTVYLDAGYCSIVK